MKKLTDVDRAVLFLYLTQVGLPSWAKGKQSAAYAVLMGKTEKWAEKIFEQMQRCGYAEKT